MLNQREPWALGALGFGLLGVLAAGACSHPRPPSPMKNEVIPVTQQLVLALFDFGTSIDRRGLRACSKEYPAVTFVEEVEVHRRLREAGRMPEEMLTWGEKFESFPQMGGIHLLLLTYKNGSTTYLRTVNYLGKYVTTVSLDIDKPSCGDILRAQRVVGVDSTPPLADVLIDERQVGEAPIWMWLKDGSYKVDCKLPGQTFASMSLTVPKTVLTTCQRQNMQTGGKTAGEEDDKVGAEEGAGTILIVIVGIAAAAAAILVPILLLF